MRHFPRLLSQTITPYNDSNRSGRDAAGGCRQSLLPRRIPFSTIRKWCAIAFAMLLWPSIAGAVDLGDSILRDYPVSLTLPKKRVEISLDYARIDNSLFSDKARPANAHYLNSGPEETNGGRVLLNYGLFDRTTLQTGFFYRSLDYEAEDMDVASFDISVKQNLSDRMFGWFPFVTLDAGLRTDYTDDLAYHDKIDDKTLFLRLTGGEIFGNLFPNAYLEYGFTDIDATANGDADPSGLSLGLDRTESYLEAGLCVLWKFPYSAIARMEYSYLRMLRGDGLGGPASNHIFRADLNYFVTRRFILNAGGVYYHRELNGVVPFLFNNNTEGGFNRKAFEIFVGFTLLFEGD